MSCPEEDRIGKKGGSKMLDGKSVFILGFRVALGLVESVGGWYKPLLLHIQLTLINTPYNC